MATVKMQIEKRDQTGSNKVRKMRASDSIPAVLYSRGAETRHVSIKKAEFLKVYRSAGSTSLLTLDLDGEKIPAIIKEVQKHPFKEEYLHIDLQELKMDEKIKITIPVVLLNRDSIHIQPSVLAQQIDEIEVECLPSYIPSTAEVDVEFIDFDTSMYVRDLDVASIEEVTILNDLDEVVCSLTEPTIYEEEEDLLDEDEEMTEPELIGEEDEEDSEEDEE